MCSAASQVHVCYVYCTRLDRCYRIISSHGAAVRLSVVRLRSAKMAERIEVRLGGDSWGMGTTVIVCRGITGYCRYLFIRRLLFLVAAGPLVFIEL